MLNRSYEFTNTINQVISIRRPCSWINIPRSYICDHLAFEGLVKEIQVTKSLSDFAILANANCNITRSGPSTTCGELSSLKSRGGRLESGRREGMRDSHLTVWIHSFKWTTDGPETPAVSLRSVPNAPRIRRSDAHTRWPRHTTLGCIFVITDGLEPCVVRSSKKHSPQTEFIYEKKFK